MKQEQRTCDVCKREKAYRTFAIDGTELDCCSVQCWIEFWSKVWDKNTFFPELTYPKAKEVVQ